MMGLFLALLLALVVLNWLHIRCNLDMLHNVVQFPRDAEWICLNVKILNHHILNNILIFLREVWHNFAQDVSFVLAFRLDLVSTDVLARELGVQEYMDGEKA